MHARHGVTAVSDGSSRAVTRSGQPSAAALSAPLSLHSRCRSIPNGIPDESPLALVAIPLRREQCHRDVYRVHLQHAVAHRPRVEGHGDRPAVVAPADGALHNAHPLGLNPLQRPSRPHPVFFPAPSSVFDDRICRPPILSMSHDHSSVTLPVSSSPGRTHHPSRAPRTHGSSFGRLHDVVRTSEMCPGALAPRRGGRPYSLRVEDHRLAVQRARSLRWDASGMSPAAGRAQQLRRLRKTFVAIRRLSHPRRPRQRPHRYTCNHRNRHIVLRIL